jgi:hypothetical protein
VRRDVTSGAGTMARWGLLERWAVVLVALHTLGVGTMLLLAPGWSVLTFSHWPRVDPLFFVRQGGVFHFVLAFAYLFEYFRHRGVTVLVAAKAAAFAFLLASTLAGEVPWVVPFSGLVDGSMGLVVLLLHRAAQRSAVR